MQPPQMQTLLRLTWEATMREEFSCRGAAVGSWELASAVPSEGAPVWLPSMPPTQSLTQATLVATEEQLQCPLVTNAFASFPPPDQPAI